MRFASLVSFLTYAILAPNVRARDPAAVASGAASSFYLKTVVTDGPKNFDGLYGEQCLQQSTLNSLAPSLLTTLAPNSQRYALVPVNHAVNVLLPNGIGFRISHWSRPT